MVFENGKPRLSVASMIAKAEMQRRFSTPCVPATARSPPLSDLRAAFPDCRMKPRVVEGAVSAERV
jgi:hypothetical protein